MSIENKGFPDSRIENINNSLSENKELLKTKEILEKRETIGDQEKLEAYINYLVDWRNKIVAKQEGVKKQLQEMSTEENMRQFYFPEPGKSLPVGFMDVETAFSKLAEQCQEIQNERNDWANKVSSTIGGIMYDPNKSLYKEKELTQNNFFADLRGNENMEKSIKALGLNESTHSIIGISKSILEGELPLYERVENEDYLSERWLHIKDGKYIVESKYDEEESDNYSYADKEFNSYKEAENAFLT